MQVSHYLGNQLSGVLVSFLVSISSIAVLILSSLFVVCQPVDTMHLFVTDTFFVKLCPMLYLSLNSLLPNFLTFVKLVFQVLRPHCVNPLKCSIL